MPPADADPLPFDVIVAGAGAAGLLAAARSAERRRRTLLLEKNRKPGVKILMSGGTRCNITHDCDAAGIIGAFGSAGSFLHSALAALGPSELVELLHAEGLATKTEPGGKVFPTSDRAADVLAALHRRLERSGAELALGEAVEGVEREAGHFRVKTSRRRLRTEKLIVTTGGKSYPGCGTTGDGYGWLVALGHSIRPPRPALVPLTCDEAWVRELSGVTVPDVAVRVVEVEPGEPSSARSVRALIERRGSLLFTHFGLSGPVILDVSRAVTGARDPKRVALIVDFRPDMTPEMLDDFFRQAAQVGGRKSIAAIVDETLPRRLVESLLSLAGVPLDRRAAELAKTERAQMTAVIKRCEVRVTGSRGFDKAEVTAGGVALDEVDSRTMESKLVPGLFIAGEILDLDGFIGGYNFQAAFSTGWLAGESV
jgi:predicted Rossmann fold flavoprotein